MQSAAVLPAPPASPLATARVWALHMIAFIVPFYILAFTLTGPHRWYASLPWLLVIPLLMLLDRKSGPALHRPVENMPSWPFDLMLVGLTALQLANVALAARMIAAAGLLSADAFVAMVLVGANSGWSAIVVAHELIHRKSRFMQTLGRLLLCTVVYEHFYTEHVRGHHARIGTDEDPATSRYGETYGEFWDRTVRAQFVSAWRLNKRAVLQGIVAEVALLTVTLLALGPAALVFVLAQAYTAVRLLEAVNYFEHYGLRRTERKVRPVDSWDSDSWFTLFALVGLSRHADHHAYASRPFQSLRTWEESPKLPHGYVVTTLMVIFANRRLREELGAELARRRLGPFAAPAA